MTRFARSKGSKSSNERIPEQATPWDVMRKQLQDKQTSAEDSSKRAEFEAIRKENYEKFLNEEKSNKTCKSWCEFPDGNENTTVQSNPVSESKNKKKKRKKNKVQPEAESEFIDLADSEKSLDVDDPELSKWCDEYSDRESNERLKELTSKLDEICKKDSKKNKHLKNAALEKSDDVKVSHENKKNKRKPKNTTQNIKEEDIDDDMSHLTNETINMMSPTEIESDVSSKKSKSAKKRKLLLDHEDNPDDVKMKKQINNIPKTDTVKQVDKKKKKDTNKSFSENKFSTSDSKNKMETASKQNKKEHARRKPVPEGKNILILNGEEVEVVTLHGFPITAKDGQRIQELRKSLISKGIPRSEVERTVKLERRKAEKTLARLKKNLCFHCRKGGHMLSECPDLNKEESKSAMPSAGICFKCGSTEHTHFACRVVRTQDYKFAQCFICKEQGHISRQCPDNPKGIYPKGGACRMCGDVTHLKKDCPQIIQQREDDSIRLETLQSENLEDIGQTTITKATPSLPKIKHVKF